MRRVIFVSQRQAESMRPPRAAALISITDPHRPLANLSSNWTAVLRVAFDDVDAITFPGQDLQLREISACQVADIAGFIAAEWPRCKRFVVHCRHGVSRSAAVAKAIAEASGLWFPPEYNEYNRFVYLALRRPVAYALGAEGAVNRTHMPAMHSPWS